MKSSRTASTGKVTSTKGRSRKESAAPSSVYPFSAIVGQEEMKLALVLNVIDPLICGVLIMGHRGTGKSTAVRGLAELLPEVWAVRNCLYRCDPVDAENLCSECKAKLTCESRLKGERVAVRVVDLPLGATEDRVCGTIDIERALQAGTKAFEPGLLARANRGFLYIDEVNLLEDHLADVLLDAASSGRNRVERESISIEHPARFVLIGSGNPEEGELRPQLQDRFGLHVEVTTDNRLDSRVAVVKKREAFERDARAFSLATKDDQDRLRLQITRAQKRFAVLNVDEDLLRQIAQLCSDLKIDGHRGELTITRAARALAAFEGHRRVTAEEVKRVAVMALRHRLRRDALEETASAEKIREALERVFSSSPGRNKRTSGNGDESPPDETSGNGLQLARESGARVAKASGGSAVNPRGESGDEGVLTLTGSAELGALIPELKIGGVRRSSKVLSRSRRNCRAKQSRLALANPELGRYSRAVSFKTARVATDATLRAEVSSRPILNTGQLIHPDSLRYKLFARKRGSLFIFAIDTSGSMALNRITQAKGALLQLLKKSYINRDWVAIVAFGGTKAQVLLPPSRSMLRARRVLDSLRVGGGTPLSAGLVCSLGIARRASIRGNSNIMLLLFTDGRANVAMHEDASDHRAKRRSSIEHEIKSLGGDLRDLGVTSVVVETRSRFVSSNEARDLAQILAAQLIQISSRAIGKLTGE